ncbi:hypothetical protein [[Mycoplasma] testudinis]|uniref:hypothetical protein n=1 Tax=[Mycoplasma] testudinis TaxID=33924 RepID=UPI0012EC196E|nr:hypothetical protein [[Mycoplasma] testudinis]
MKYGGWTKKVLIAIPNLVLLVLPSYYSYSHITKHFTPRMYTTDYQREKIYKFRDKPNLEFTPADINFLSNFNNSIKTNDIVLADVRIWLVISHGIDYFTYQKNTNLLSSEYVEYFENSPNVSSMIDSFVTKGLVNGNYAIFWKNTDYISDVIQKLISFNFEKQSESSNLSFFVYKKVGI